MSASYLAQSQLSARTTSIRGGSYFPRHPLRVPGTRDRRLAMADIPRFDRPKTTPGSPAVGTAPGSSGRRPDSSAAAETVEQAKTDLADIGKEAAHVAEAVKVEAAKQFDKARTGASSFAGEQKDAAASSSRGSPPPCRGPRELAAEQPTMAGTRATSREHRSPVGQHEGPRRRQPGRHGRGLWPAAAGGHARAGRSGGLHVGTIPDGVGAAEGNLPTPPSVTRRRGRDPLTPKPVDAQAASLYPAGTTKPGPNSTQAGSARR